MQFLVACLIFASLAHAESVHSFSEHSPAYGYIKNIGIPRAERIREVEESSGSRIIGGVPASLGQHPFQAGLLGEVILDGNVQVAICGGSLVSDRRVITAAHCWFDGELQMWRFTVVLGSIYLFSGGTRIQTSAVVVHPNWNPTLVRHDIAVIYLPGPVALSDTIAPISLPSGFQLLESFSGENAITAGFGVTVNGGTVIMNQQLRYVDLTVISASECSRAYPLVVQPSNICTSGQRSVGFCNGDTGGPLFVTRNNIPILIGISSFRSSLGCGVNRPNVYTRITSYMDFIGLHV